MGSLRGRAGQLSTARRRVPARAGQVVAALCALTVLVGCASLPTSGPVRAGQARASTAQDPVVRVIAPGPRQGAAPVDIVRGFLFASASVENGYQTAKQFLDPATARRWRPDAGVVVLRNTYTVRPAEPAARESRPGSPSRVILAGDSVGRIDSGGRYVASVPDEKVQVPFSVRRNESGEWRITDLADGLHLPRFEIDRVYRSFDLYFLTPSRDRLVADPVLLPVGPPSSSSAQQLATQLVKRLLRGPTEDLRDAVRTAFPAGTTADPESVPVDGRIAQVSLSSDVLSADVQARQQLSAQLSWTLRQLRPEVQAVHLTGGGAPLDVVGADDPQPFTAWSRFDPSGLSAAAPTHPYIVDDRRIGQLEGAQFVPLPGTAGSGRLALSSPALSPDETRVAALSVDGSRLFEGRIGEPDPFVERLRRPKGSLVDPSYDASGTLWVLDRVAGFVWVLRPDGTRSKLSLPGISGGLRQLRVSRDGIRLAVVARRSTSAAQLLVGVIERDGADVSLRPLRRLAPELSTIRDVAWSGDDQLGVLGAEPRRVLQVYRISVDGLTVEDVSTVPQQQTTSLTAAPNLPLLVGTDSGQIYEAAGRQWFARGRGQDPAYPG